MGVPKFFRFISERYPCINKIIKEHEIPQYDNLYLDMNSIIHTCSHPTDSDVHFRIGKKEFSDEDIFENVSRYVEIIFRIVKPLEMLFLAFDGVAPRAKMNQQRANRFRVARDNSILEREILLTDKLFDANSITPGTVFMADLIDHMKHFIAYKVSTDPLWQKCKIILSGSEAPGEGEHKIMQFIRYHKAQQNYNSNTRHCLYSLDADLIVLGLCTHEPHFSLLREKNTFGKAKKMLTPEESDFHLLHLSLFREYLGYEFAPIKSKLKFEFDLEKIIDDWVLIGFLVGNDFIPQLPHLNIVNGALPLLYSVYIEVLPTLDGYINEAGELNLSRFEKYIKSLSHVEHKIFASTVSSKICNVKEAKKVDPITGHFEQLSIESKKDDAKDLDQEMKTKEYSNFEVQRRDYYLHKLNFEDLSESLILPLVHEYIRAIQWTLNYYYHGCCSWSWYFPYHYAPFIRDVKGLENINLKFDMAKPFLPLQHLLAVLPPANSHLLPKPLRFLLTNSNSPIIHFYPNEFEIDLNDKSNDWEAIVLIPFINEKELISAMDSYITTLNPKERHRNTNGLTCVYTYTKTDLGYYPVDKVFGSFINHAQMERINIADMNVSKNKLVKGLCKDVRFDLSFPGFPTFRHIPHTFGFQMIESKMICNRPIKIEKIMLNVSIKPVPKLEEIAKELLGQKVFINWPYLQEAYVIGVTDFDKKIMLDNFWKNYSEDNLKHAKLSDNSRSSLEEEYFTISDGIYNNGYGIVIGKTEILVYVFPAMGKRYVYGNSGKVQLQTRWSTLSKICPYQLIVKEAKFLSVDLMYKSIRDIFATSDCCFMLGYPNYGSIGQVKSVNFRQQRVVVSLTVTEEPIFTSTEDFFVKNNNDYMSPSTIAKSLSINSTLINRITGSLLVAEDTDKFGELKYHDIGLRIKFPKQQKELFGYSHKKDTFWYYSQKAVQLLQNYTEKFPDLFVNLNKNVTSSTFTVSELFPQGSNELNAVKSWLLEQQVLYTTFLECGTKTLGLDGVPKLDKFLCDFRSKQSESKVVEAEVSSQLLFRPGTIVGLIPPDLKAQHKLLDRIICCRANFTVPLGHKGTIIGIQEKQDKWKNVYEVLFDSPFTAGLTLYESFPHKCYRLTIADFVNISFGQRNASTRPTNEKPKTDVKNAPPPRPNCPNNFRSQPLKNDKEPAVVRNNNAKIKLTGHSTTSVNRNQPPSHTENRPPVTTDNRQNKRPIGRNNNSRNESSQVKNRPAAASNNSAKVQNPRRINTKKRPPLDTAESKKNTSQ
ncbi:5'-3' exoribonuclease 1 [Nasonia vitripennis]|uniref:5'-3' exoribonuclease 1 n=1 Tax=Nasonia vitripennis TaxID=7425 RepID=A0A7M7H8P8_NASVI|nr:5'-3' exoribonuclease 1 [Nasonia vitripennis]